jgi:hypothetical protein
MAMLDGLVPGTVLTIGAAPSAAMAMTYIAMANSIGVAMGNAVTAQQRGQLIGEAATVKVVAVIFELGAT